MFVQQQTYVDNDGSPSRYISREATLGVGPLRILVMHGFVANDRRYGSWSVEVTIASRRFGQWLQVAVGTGAQDWDDWAAL